MNDLITLKGKHVKTNSIIIAEKFGKQHKNVVKKIEQILSEEKNDGVAGLNFKLSSYQSEQNKELPMYEMNRRGFTELVLGFTGKKARHWRRRFLDAFEAMEKALLQKQNLSWKQLRLDGKKARHELTDEIQSFIEYATNQGSRSAQMYYRQITKMTNQALFLIGCKAPQDFRDMLDNMQLAFLQSAEFVARNGLREGMESGMHYKDIYKLARDKVRAFAGTVGQTPISLLEANRGATIPYRGGLRIDHRGIIKSKEVGNAGINSKSQ